MMIRDLRSFVFKLKGRGKAVDHVHDLALGGSDERDNLWPIRSQDNSRANAVYNHEVPVLETGSNKLLRKRLLDLVEKWFVIKKIG